MQCLSPEFVFKFLLNSKPVSLILTSGTLSPIPSLSKEIGVDFGDNILYNRHVIKPEQVFGAVLTSGIDGQKL